jgi:hypothetical protein
MFIPKIKLTYNMKKTLKWESNNFILVLKLSINPKMKHHKILIDPCYNMLSKHLLMCTQSF